MQSLIFFSSYNFLGFLINCILHAVTPFFKKQTNKKPSVYKVTVRRAQGSTLGRKKIIIKKKISLKVSPFPRGRFIPQTKAKKIKAGFMPPHPKNKQ
ncbi:hypothetical protein FK515_29705, partial [Klebsiella pneumoniae]|nr:hypothetical protein [Klebsiella pneumoniae]